MSTPIIATKLYIPAPRPLCDRLMPGPGMSGKAALAELDRKNLFVVPLDHVHPLEIVLFHPDLPRFGFDPDPSLSLHSGEPA